MKSLKHIYVLTKTLFKIEFRHLTSLLVAGIYVLISFFIFAVALPKEWIPAEYANAGVLWSTVFFSASSLASQMFMTKDPHSFTQSLLLTGISATNMFFARWLMLCIYMLCMVFLSLPILFLFSGAALPKAIDSFFTLILLTCVSYSAVSTLFSSLLSKEKLSELFLPVLVLPLTVPILIVSVKSSVTIFSGGTPQLFFLLGYSLIIVPCTVLLSEYVIEME